MSVLVAVSRAAVRMALSSAALLTKSPEFVPHRERRRHNRLDHRADRAGIGRVLGDDVAGRLDGAATGVREDDDQRRAEHGGAVFDRTEGAGVHEIARIARDEELADAVAAEDQLGRHAAVGATDDRRPGRLVRRRRRCAVPPA